MRVPKHWILNLSGFDLFLTTLVEEWWWIHKSWWSPKPKVMTQFSSNKTFVYGTTYESSSYKVYNYFWLGTHSELLKKLGRDKGLTLIIIASNIHTSNEYALWALSLLSLMLRVSSSIKKRTRIKCATMWLTFSV